MGPSLQRLLRRPAALDLLSLLVGGPLPALVAPSTVRKARLRCLNCSRSVTQSRAATAAARDPTLHPRARNGDTALSSRRDDENVDIDPECELDNSQSQESLLGNRPAVPKTETTPRYSYATNSAPQHGWAQRLGPIGLARQADFTRRISATRLVDVPEYTHDLYLWRTLLLHQKNYGSVDGVAMVWNAMRLRNVKLPVAHGMVELWHIFTEHGLQQDHELLDAVVEYAEQLWKSEREVWSGLYYKIVTHMLLDEPSAALEWHERLVTFCPPTRKRFARMVANTIIARGHVSELKYLYDQMAAKHKIYDILIPILCNSGIYEEAKRWHYLLLQHGDGPSSPLATHPLLHWLRENRPEDTRMFLESLKPFSELVSVSQSHADPQAQRETSRTRVKVVADKDNTSARWLATRWIPLDMIYSSMQARGLNIIGPLSLQAIALRLSTTENLSAEFTKLKALGIGIEDTVYTRALQHYAEERNNELLQLLITSDQHPSNFEDRELQEEILVSFAKADDDANVRLTLEMATFEVDNPESVKANLLLMVALRLGKLDEIIARVTEMIAKRQSLSETNVGHLVERFMHNRRKGKSPRRTEDSTRRFKILLSLLNLMLETKLPISPFRWREVLVRLQMLGWFDELHQVCIRLALQAQQAHGKGFGQASLSAGRLHNQLSSDINLKRRRAPYSNDFRTTQILFSPSFQRSVVVWGFIHSYSGGPNPPDCTIGLTILRSLQDLGVEIDKLALGATLLQRFSILYGSSIPMRDRNRAARLKNNIPIDALREKVHKALGEEILPSPLVLQRAILSYENSIQLSVIERGPAEGRSQEER